jgi:hypothetical protein
MFNSPTIASITAGFTKQVQQLQELAKKEWEKSEDCERRVADLESEGRNSQLTAERATTLADRLKAFTDV